MVIPGEETWPPDEIDETDRPLRVLGERFSYTYDFGDNWEHDVTALGAGGERVGCVDGEGICPPEDCGGPGGYAELLAALADPTHEDYQHMREWVGDRLRPFDRDHVDAYVVQMAGAVPATVRLLLDLIGDGVRLTQAGRLPRAIVWQVQDAYPAWHWDASPATTEHDLWPLAELHDLLRRAGVLRLRHGVLAPTRAAADDAQVVRRLRGCLPPAEFHGMLVEIITALLAARGPLPVGRLGSLVWPEIGSRWSVDGRPITEADVQRQVHHAASMLQALDLADASSAIWSAGPSARTLLPGATLRAEVWATVGTED